MITYCIVKSYLATTKDETHQVHDMKESEETVVTTIKSQIEFDF